MKIGLLSDIHGNAEALSAVLSSAQRQGLKRLICAGDIVGYYYEPHKCLDLLSEWDISCVRGNHEQMLFQLINDPSLSEGLRLQYGSGLSIALDFLTSDHLKYLANLRDQEAITIQDKNFLICHGAPWDINYYVYPDAGDEVFRRCTESGVAYVVLGHTHYQLSKRYGHTLIINPGSIGQPRGKYCGFAHWAILDILTGNCEHQSVEYDVESVIAQAKKYDPDVAYLQSILLRSSS